MGTDKKLKKGERAAIISILVSLFLSIIKAIVGYLSGSIVLITDAVHSGADSITGFASWFGLRIAQKKPSERFPYGYYKAENIATLIVSVFIFYAAIGLMQKGYSKLFVIPELSRPYEALAVALSSSIVSYFLSRYMKKVGEEVNSQSLIANAQERRVDILSSMIVFVAIVLTYYNIPYAEGAITIFISLLALKVGIEVARDSVYSLMDVSPDMEVENKIRSVLDSNTGIESFDSLKLRKSGPTIFGEVNVKIRKNVDVKRAHDISNTIENHVKHEINDLESLTIHVEPYQTEKETVVLPIKNKKGLSSDIMSHFGRAKYFIFVEIDRKNGDIASNYIKENPYVEEELRAGFKAANFVKDEKIDALITLEIGGISIHTLRDNLVDVYKTDGGKVKIIVEKYINGKLEPLKTPTKDLGELSDKIDDDESDEPGINRWWGRRRRGRK